MLIEKDKQGTFHVVIGPKEIEENLPEVLADMLAAADYCIDVDPRVDHVGEMILKGLERYDRGRKRVL